MTVRRAQLPSGSTCTDFVPSRAPTPLSAPSESSTSSWSGRRSPPEYPPASTAPTPSASPASSSSVRSDVPNGRSKSSKSSPKRPTEKSPVPGSLSVPAWRNQSAPYALRSATLARVSTFCTSVGRPQSPCVAGNGGRIRGFGGFPSSPARSAVSSPATYARETSLTSTSTPDPTPDARTSAQAERSPSSSSRSPSGTATIIFSIPSSCATASAPSSTTKRRAPSRNASFTVPGSRSAPFATSVASGPSAAHLRAAGKPAPP